MSELASTITGPLVRFLVTPQMNCCRKDQTRVMNCTRNSEHWRTSQRRAGCLAGLVVFSMSAALLALAQQPLRVHSQAPNAIRADRANLNGMVVPGANPATVWFEWGTSRQYGNLVGMTHLPAGNRVVAIRHELNGLSQGYVYHYRLVSSNLAGTVYGADQQFTLGGSVTVWGNPNFGHTIVPSDLTHAVAISAGSDHCLALRDDGTVAAWGGNFYGQRDVPFDVTEAVAVAGGQYHTLALLPDGTVRAWGAGTTYSQTFPEGGQSIVPAGLSDVVQIAAGTSHSLALKADGTVAAWGSARLFIDVWNDMGQSQVPAGLNNVVAIAGGDFHSLALKADGTVVVWGYNTHGQGAIPPGLTNVVAIAAGWYHNFALQRDGTLVAWGLGLVNTGFPYFGQAIVPPGLTDVTGMAGGGFYSLAHRADGTVVGWGRDDDFGVASGANGLTDVVALAGGYDFGMALQTSAPLEVGLKLKPFANQLEASWTGGVLESSENPEGPYSEIIGATSPLILDPVGTRQFYRLRVQR